jgi:hypothetical protein
MTYLIHYVYVKFKKTFWNNTPDGKNSYYKR